MTEFDTYEENLRVLSGYKIVRTNPYGHWIILNEKDKKVSSIDGTFTNPQTAASALKNYIDNLPKVPAPSAASKEKK